MLRLPSARALALLLPLLFPAIASAQGALTNGANHSGSISAAAQIDEWTFAATAGDAILVRIGETLPAGPDPGFWPWIQLLNPSGTVVASQYGALAAEVGVVAGLTGTYTVRVQSADSGNDALGDYVLRLAKIPGAFTVPGGDEGGALANGSNHPGHIAVGDVDMWTFTANQNESAIIRIGEVPVDPGTPDPGFWPWLRVYGPLGTYIEGQYGDRAAEVGFVAPLTGTYTVVVVSADSGYDAVGDYILRLAKMPGAFTVPDGDQGGALTNGSNHPGHITIGDVDMWSFTANQNESAIIRIGEVVPSGPDPGFWPWLRVYGPLGTYVEGQYGDQAAEVGFIAPLTGTYTVVVVSADSGYDAEGDYILRLARIPGTFVDENGGPMTNGGNHPGRIEVGDVDTWTFTANQNDSAIIRIGEVPVDSSTPDPGFWPWIRIYGPLGTYIEGQYGDRAAEVGFVVPLSGSYTVVVVSADSGYNAQGDYILRLARMPGAFTVPAADHGGAMTNGVTHPGRIEIGDVDMWSFAACLGASVAVTINEVPVGPGTPDPGFWPWIRLYNSAGALASNGSAYGDTVAQINHTVTQPGTFTLVVSTADSGYDATGDYTVRVQVVGGSCPSPTTVPDSYTTAVNTALNVAAPGVLGNDISNGGGAMTAELVDPVTSGALVLNANGSFTFTPSSGFTGEAIFRYRAVNSFGAGNTANVTLTVGGTLPTTADDGYSTGAGVPLNVPVPGILGNDTSNGGGPLSAQLVNTTMNGILTLAAAGSFSYSPNPGFAGADSFRYRAVNNVGSGNEASVTITVVTGPQPPTELYAAKIKRNTVMLRFKPPTAGPAPTGYVLKGGVRPGEVLASIPTGSTNPIYTFDAPSGVFYVRMHTLAGAVESEASNEIRIWVNALDVPSAPANLIGMANGSSIALAWRNTFAGGEPGGVVLDVSGSLNASLPLGLTDSFQFNSVPGGTYTLSVRAVNAAGTSPPSNAITLTFPSPTCSGAPLPPSEFLAYRLGNTIHVVWEPAATGSAPTSYVLTVTGSFNSTFGTPGRTLSGTVGPGSYTLSVAAANACGMSAATSVQTVVVP